MGRIYIIDAGGPHELVTVEFMRRRGHFERMGVEVERTYVTNGGDAVDLLLAGRADAAMQVGFGPALSAIAQGAPLKVIGGANLLAVHAIYARDPAIRRLSDLEGRTVGVGRLGALTHQLIYAALLKHGVDPAKVDFVTIGNSAAVFKALQAGKVDAGFGETEVFHHQGRYGVHALEDGALWRELPQFPNQASFATEAAIREKRDVLVRTLAAHALLYRDLHDPECWEEFAATWTAALPDSPLDEGRVQWAFYQDHHPFAADLMLPRASLDFLQDLNVAMGLQPTVLPYEAVIDVSLTQDALRMIDEKEART